jgi:type I restriction-modification system DNA methylase subunit
MIWIAPTAKDADKINDLWIQLFHSALNEKGRAGFVMANSTRKAHSCSMKSHRRRPQIRRRTRHRSKLMISR